LFLNPRRIARSAIIIKPSTLLRFHNALKKRKYRLLYSPGGGRQPGPKGPSAEVINAVCGYFQNSRRKLVFHEEIYLCFAIDLF
jgi:putative transposase